MLIPIIEGMPGDVKKLWFFISFNLLKSGKKKTLGLRISSKLLCSYLSVDLEGLKIALYNLSKTKVYYESYSKKKEIVSTYNQPLIIDYFMTRNTVLVRIHKDIVEVAVPIQLSAIKGKDRLSKRTIELYTYIVSTLPTNKVTVTVEQLKKIMNVNKKSYTEYPAFNANVLKKVVNEINEKTILNIIYKPALIRCRKTEEIMFKFEIKDIQSNTCAVLRDKEFSSIIKEFYTKTMSNQKTIKVKRNNKKVIERRLHAICKSNTTHD